jgi:hypothetical protein
MRQHRWRGAPARCWHWGRRCLRDDIAGSAGIFRPDVADHLEAAGNVIQHFGDVFAEFGHAFTAIRAGAGAIASRLVLDVLARQMLRQRFAFRLGSLPDWLGSGFSFGFFRLFRLGRFQFFQPQFQLLDLAGDPFR